MKCEDCKFAHKIESPTAVECRRFPPRVYKVDGYQITSPFPLLAKNAWCGEYQPYDIPGISAISRGKRK